MSSPHRRRKLTGPPTPQQVATLRPGDIVSWVSPVEPSTEFPGFEEGTTAIQWLRGLLEEAQHLESGVEGSVAPASRVALDSDPEFRRAYLRMVEKRQEWRDGGCRGPEPQLPKPPGWAQVAEARAGRELRAVQRAEARALRTQARAAQERVRAERAHRRRRPVLRLVPRRTGHCGRHRPAGAPARQTTAASAGRGDPHEPPGGDDPPGHRAADEPRPPELPSRPRAAPTALRPVPARLHGLRTQH